MSLFSRIAPRRGAGLFLLAAASGTLALIILAPVSGGIELQERPANAQSMPTPQPYQVEPGCDSPGTPTGQANPSDEPEPMSAIWCYQLNNGPTTRVAGANDWVDTFQTNQQMQVLGATNLVSGNNLQDESNSDDYYIFNNLTTGGSNGNLKSQGFINNNHWMFDLAGANIEGGTLLSPQKGFNWENGKLVVESDVAAGLQDYGGADRFVELDVNPSSVVTDGKNPQQLGINCGNNTEQYGQYAGTCKSPDPLYGYGQFPGYWSLGCRLESQGNVICSLYNPDGASVSNGDHFDGAGRVWEISPIESGTDIQTLYEIPGIFGNQQAWRQCLSGQMDMYCRDRFRLELTKTTVTLYVNGIEYFAFGLIPGHSIPGVPDAGQLVPNAIANNPSFTYFTTWVSAFNTDPSVRFHWGRVAINPHNPDGSLMGPSASPSYCAGQPQNTCPMGGMGGGMPTNTPVPTPNSTMTSVPTSTATPTSGSVGTQNVITFDDLANPGRVLSGQYPNGIIDWGSNAWWLSGPYAQDSTNSVSFNGATPTSASFNFLVSRTLLQLDAINGGTTSSTVTLSCPGQATQQATVGGGQKVTIHTGWTAACASVTIGSSNGWGTNFDNLVVATVSGGAATNTPTSTPTQAATNTPAPTSTPTHVPATSTPTATPTGPRTVTFDDLSNPNQPLNGQYPTGLIDWGTTKWWLAGPYANDPTNSVSFNGNGPTSAVFTLIGSHQLLQLQAINGGPTASTVSLSCAGKPTRSVSVPAGQVATIKTGWSGTCTAVTVTSSNGWSTNFDNFVIQ